MFFHVQSSDISVTHSTICVNSANLDVCHVSSTQHIAIPAKLSIMCLISGHSPVILVCLFVRTGSMEISPTISVGNVFTIRFRVYACFLVHLGTSLNRMEPKPSVRIVVILLLLATPATEATPSQLKPPTLMEALISNTRFTSPKL